MRPLHRVWALAFALASAAALGDDTDIYVDAERADAAQPLVMFSLDYRANLTRAVDEGAGAFFQAQGLGRDVELLSAMNDGGLVLFDVLILSLKLALAEAQGIRIGLMLSHNESGRGSGALAQASDGGAILMGFQPIDLAPTRKVFEDKLLALKRLKLRPSDADHPYQGAELFYEFFRYLTGQAVHQGHHGLHDFESGGAIDLGTNMRCGSGDAGVRAACWDPGIEVLPERSRYRSPLADVAACSRIFTVNFLFQVSQQDADASMFETERERGGLGIAAPSSGNQHFPAMLAFLRDVDLAEDPVLDEDSVGEGFGALPEMPGRQNVLSYFIVDPSQINTTTRAYATAGGTAAPVPLASDPEQLVASLRAVLQQILSVSTTLVAAAVPVNVFNRAQVLDDVYFALFQADADGRPFWEGNLKKLRLASEPVADEAGRPVGRALLIADALGRPAISPLDGRLMDDALTFWTDATGDELSAGDVNGDGEVEPVALNAASPGNPERHVSQRDGRHVARGAAGQKIPGFRDAQGGPGDANGVGRRNLHYLSPATGTLAPLEVNAGVATDVGANTLGSRSLAEALDVLRFARGQDVGDADGDGNRTEARPWIMGDALHSRPLPINYGVFAARDDGIGGGSGTYGVTNPGVFVAMASNDGYLRLFRDTLPDGTQSGEEVWAFMPEEGLAQQARLMGGPAAPGGYPHPYTFDGEATALVVDTDGDGTIEPGDGDRVYLYAGLRRGGRRYYAFDITDPYQPRFQWRIGNDGLLRAGASSVERGSAADFAQLGLSFSRPRVGAVFDGRGTGGGPARRLAVFFGGGYHGGPPEGGRRPGKDDRGVGTDDPIGNAVFVVDARTGALVWKAVGGSAAGATPGGREFVHPELRDSVPSALAVVDTDGDGLHDRLLFGDTGGNVWRADLGGDADGDGQFDDDWRLTRVACLGRHGGPECATRSGKDTDRRFFHEPDLVQGRAPDGTRYDAIVLGSGDRENPLDRAPDAADRDGDGNRLEETRRGHARTLNRFYVIRDPNTGVGAGADLDVTEADLGDVTSTCLDGPCVLGPRGWRLDLDHDAGGGAQGEKVLSPPTTIANAIFFTSYLPPAVGDALACGPAEGAGFLYTLRLDDGAPFYDYDTTDAPGSKADRRLDLGTPGIPAQVVYLGSSQAFAPPGEGDASASGGATGAAASGTCSLQVLAGARILPAPGCPRFRSFWLRAEH